jgi:hypothetical protein
MDSHTTRSHVSSNARIAAALIALTLSATTGHAATDTEGDIQAIRHVRTLDSRLRALIVQGARQSPLFRTLIDRLNRSTVIVYVQSRLLSGNLSGRLTFAGSGQPWRYLRIEIECRQTMVDQIAALGHELQHAAEIADAATAVDESSIRALYGTIGFATDSSQRRFETNAARDAGHRVRRELFSRPVEITIGTNAYDLK